MRRWLAPILVLVLICIGLPAVAAAEPALLLEENCTYKENGVQAYGVYFGVTGFPPSSQVSGSIDFELINADGTTSPGGGGTATVTTDADGSYRNQIGLLGQPSIITVTVDSDLLPGGTQSRSVRATCESAPAPKTAPRPKLVRQCRRGGYRRFKFESQRQCVAYVRRGPRSR
ncbi:MAG TPA: hypothetical protein VJT75_18130 [Thermoleophilaceae bacterium]|nr:hypothetical protein [Thermoleophilaceae bacterium]